MELFLSKCREAWDQKGVVDGIKDQLAQANAKFTKIKAEVEKAMEDAEIEKQHIPGFGTLYRRRKFSVKIPKTPEDKKAFFDWIADNKGEDVLFSLQSIASATVNSLYKEELAIAKEEGNVDFKIPGVGKPKVYYDISMTKR